MKAFVLLKVDVGRLFDVLDEVKKTEGVREAYAITGEWDVIAFLEVEKPEDIARIVGHKLQGLKGVRGTLTFVAVSE